MLEFFIKTSVATYVSRDEQGKINGYVNCRQLDTCHSLQPFYADTPDVAEKLLVKVPLLSYVCHVWTFLTLGVNNGPTWQATICNAKREQGWLGPGRQVLFAKSVQI